MIPLFLPILLENDKNLNFVINLIYSILLNIFFFIITIFLTYRKIVYAHSILKILIVLINISKMEIKLCETNLFLLS